MKVVPLTLELYPSAGNVVTAVPGLAAIEAEYFGNTLTVTLLVEFKPAASVALIVTVYEDLVEYVAVTESFNFKEPLTISKEPASVPDSS